MAPSLQLGNMGARGSAPPPLAVNLSISIFSMRVLESMEWEMDPWEMGMGMGEGEWCGPWKNPFAAHACGPWKNSTAWLTSQMYMRYFPAVRSRSNAYEL
jgi:hypothetical protein